ncbi:MAG: hypothetical protein CMM25_07285 [Rhodospirillaceae bacterium]|jgi:hypothetical protein|nr:hypothetical protein [Rhodospirillaceae bacterium]|tara:strand:+ start:207 stop:503 length:297 start_codon:yes stop_codon:yes gene_type:complete
MALEDNNISINLDKLKDKLKKRYPDYNFDIQPEPDTRHKSPFICKDNDIFYTDAEGNRYCGARYKHVEDDNIYKWEYRVCHALVEKADQGADQDELPF